MTANFLSDLRFGARLLALGVALGLFASVMAGRTVVSLLFGVTVGDPLVLGAACALLCGTAVAASYLPARRASRVDRLVALRYE